MLTNTSVRLQVSAAINGLTLCSVLLGCWWQQTHIHIDWTFAKTCEFLNLWLLILYVRHPKFRITVLFDGHIQSQWRQSSGIIQCWLKRWACLVSSFSTFQIYHCEPGWRYHDVIPVCRRYLAKSRDAHSCANMCNSEICDNELAIHIGYMFVCFNPHPLDKMAAISQTTFSIAFLWMKSSVIRFKFHWSLFTRVQLTATCHWFR